MIPLLSCVASPSGGGGGSVQDAAVVAALHEEVDTIGVLTWQGVPAGETEVAFRVEEEAWRVLPGDEVEGRALLLGLPYEARVTWQLRVDGLPQAEGELRLPAAPPDMPEPAWAEGDGWDPQVPWLLLSVSEATSGVDYLQADWWVQVLDRQGRVVWAREVVGGTALHPRVSAAGGHLLVDRATPWSDWDDGAASTVTRLRLDGSEEETIPTPGLHHPFTDRADGALYWAAIEGEDQVVHVREADGAQARLWSCGEWLGEACGANSLSWTGQSLLVTLYSHGTVVEVDGTTGQALRWFGQVEGGWPFDPPEAGLWWPHGAHYLPDGHLLVSTWQSAEGVATVVREYALDEASGTLPLTWSFGEDGEVFAKYYGEAWRLPGGNTWHNTGSVPRLREVDAAGTVLWDLGWSSGHWLGRTTPIPDLYALVP